MSGDRMRFAKAAEALVGAPFRLHGRDPLTGLDCMGVVAAALAAVGRPVTAPCDYRLRRRHVDALLPLAHGAGLCEADGASGPGDIYLLRTAPAQWHLAIAALSGGIVHADAGLRRVVLAPPPLLWPVERCWRLS